MEEDWEQEQIPTNFSYTPAISSKAKRRAQRAWINHTQTPQREDHRAYRSPPAGSTRPMVPVSPLQLCPKRTTPLWPEFRLAKKLWNFTKGANMDPYVIPEEQMKRTLVLYGDESRWSEEDTKRVKSFCKEVEEAGLVSVDSEGQLDTDRYPYDCHRQVCAQGPHLYPYLLLGGPRLSVLILRLDSRILPAPICELLSVPHLTLVGKHVRGELEVLRDLYGVVVSRQRAVEINGYIDRVVSHGTVQRLNGERVPSASLNKVTHGLGVAAFLLMGFDHKPRWRWAEAKYRDRYGAPPPTYPLGRTAGRLYHWSLTLTEWQLHYAIIIKVSEEVE